MKGLDANAGFAKIFNGGVKVPGLDDSVITDDQNTVRSKLRAKLSQT